MDPRTELMMQYHGPSGPKLDGSSNFSSNKWLKRDSDSDNESSEKNYKNSEQSYVSANKRSMQYSNAVKKALRQAKEDVKKTGRNKAWSEDQAEAYFMKAMAKSMEQNLHEEAPKATHQHRRRRDERGAAEQSDDESSASSQSGWRW
jgi:hypothetical protein